MATIYDPKTADDQYEKYNVAAVVFDLGEDTSIGSGFSTIKSVNFCASISFITSLGSVNSLKAFAI